jgi:hypothetical protein
MKTLVCILSLFSCVVVAQDFNATVVVDASRINQSNLQIFNSLEKQLSDFINKTSFSEKRIETAHRIPVNFFLNISAYENNSFEATLQIQSSRPIYNSMYMSPLVLIKDPEVSFQFQEFAPLILNENNIDNNLVAIFSYYAYLVIALDADSFSFNSGSAYYSKAQNVMALAQSRSFSGWTLNNRSFNRVLLLNLLSNNESVLFKKALYEYHLKGLDNMIYDPVNSKQSIVKAIGYLKSFGNNGTHRTLVQSFFDAKANEILDIFTGGPQIPIDNLVTSLQSLAPLFGDYWSAIK